MIKRFTVLQTSASFSVVEGDSSYVFRSRFAIRIRPDQNLVEVSLVKYQ